MDTEEGNRVKSIVGMQLCCTNRPPRRGKLAQSRSAVEPRGNVARTGDGAGTGGKAAARAYEEGDTLRTRLR